MRTEEHSQSRNPVILIATFEWSLVSVYGPIIEILLEISKIFLADVSSISFLFYSFYFLLKQEVKMELE